MLDRERPTTFSRMYFSKMQSTFKSLHSLSLFFIKTKFLAPLVTVDLTAQLEALIIQRIKDMVGWNCFNFFIIYSVNEGRFHLFLDIN